MITQRCLLSNGAQPLHYQQKLREVDARMADLSQRLGSLSPSPTRPLPRLNAAARRCRATVSAEAMNAACRQGRGRSGATRRTDTNWEASLTTTRMCRG